MLLAYKITSTRIFGSVPALIQWGLLEACGSIAIILGHAVKELNYKPEGRGF
jgi:hypothetical protein